MKNFFLSLSIIFSLVFVSCASSNPVYTVISGDGGQVFFLRPLTLSVDNPMIDQMDFDITVNAVGGSLTQPPVLNYSLVMPIEQSQYADDIKINIVSESIVVQTESPSLLYKEISGKKYMNLRYSAALNRDDFSKLLESNEDCLIQITGTDGTKNLIDSDEFNLRMDNLRLMML